jgi:hypothetical protein
MTSKTENTKKTLFESWIQDDHILIHLDARKDTVLVPQHLKSQHALTLKLSILFQGETKADDEKISSYLRFNNEYFECILPWEAIWGMTSDQGVQKIWEKDLPKEIFHQAARMMIQSMGDKIKAPFRKESTDDKNEKSAQTKEPESPDTPTEKRKSFLRRIK